MPPRALCKIIRAKISVKNRHGSYGFLRTGSSFGEQQVTGGLSVCARLCVKLEKEMRRRRHGTGLCVCVYVFVSRTCKASRRRRKTEKNQGNAIPLCRDANRARDAAAVRRLAATQVQSNGSPNKIHKYVHIALHELERRSRQTRPLGLEASLGSREQASPQALASTRAHTTQHQPLNVTVAAANEVSCTAFSRDGETRHRYGMAEGANYRAAA